MLKQYIHYAEICPKCGAVGSMKANVRDPKRKGRYLFKGRSVVVGTERRLYVACSKCLCRGVRITRMPPD